MRNIVRNGRFHRWLQGTHSLTSARFLHVCINTACFYHHTDIVALLLENHADPHVVDRKGRRPLHVARGEAQPRIAAMLEVKI